LTSSGGTGGGGQGGAQPGVDGNGSGAAGATNTGSGGGGGGQSFQAPKVGGPGGSGLVVLRYPAELTITIGAGLTGSTTTVGANKVTTITSGTGQVSWAA
jgi:hypothetical protein